MSRPSRRWQRRSACRSICTPQHRARRTARRRGWTALSPRADGTVDRTHLNTRGQPLRVAPLVIRELRAGVPGLAAFFRDQPAANAVVSADGGADYTTVQDAINALPQNTRADRRWVIFVRAGTYRELVYVQREKRFVSLVGEDPVRTIVTYDRKASDIGPDGLAIGTFRTPSVQIDADDFTIENLTLQNDAGPVGQALAIRIDGDRVVIRNCRFLGWQDTITIAAGGYIEDRSSRATWTSSSAARLSSTLSCARLARRLHHGRVDSG
jgi:hypothetical protein